MDEELKNEIVIRDNVIVAYKENGIVNRLSGVTVNDDEFVETDKNIVIVNGKFLFDDSEEYINEYLNSCKENKIIELKQQRDIAEQLPVTTDKGTFDVDDKSITRITNAITVLQLTEITLDWTLADNTVVEVDSRDLQRVIIMLAQQSNEVHEKYRELKEKVNACTTSEEVSRISWEGIAEEEPAEEFIEEVPQE